MVAAQDVQSWDECWEQAVYWFQLAAEQGDAAAQCNLATCYLKGQGVSADREEAIRWCEHFFASIETPCLHHIVCTAHWRVLAMPPARQLSGGTDDPLRIAMY